MMNTYEQLIAEAKRHEMNGDLATAKSLRAKAEALLGKDAPVEEIVEIPTELGTVGGMNVSSLGASGESSETGSPTSQEDSPEADASASSDTQTGEQDASADSSTPLSVTDIGDGLVQDEDGNVLNPQDIELA